MITIIKKVYLVFYKIVEDMICFLIVVINLILRIVKKVKDVVENIFRTISNLSAFFQRFFLYLPSNISKTTFLLSSKNDNPEKYSNQAPPVFKF
jgi:phage-related protein